MSTDPTASSIVAEQRPTVLPEGYTVEGGHLHMHGLDLAALADYWLTRAGQDDAPLTIRYLPSVSARFRKAQDAFAEATRQTNYPGKVRLAYASKANPNRAVIRAALSAGADYECSSRTDVSIVRYAIDHEWLTPDKLIIANGFKIAGYADALIAIASDGYTGVTPVFDAADEISHFADSGVPMNVGLRLRVGGRSDRFGMGEAELFDAAARIGEAPNLSLTLLHAIEVYPVIGNPDYFASLDKAIETFKRLRSWYPTLQWFDVGGGLPTELAEPDDLTEWMVAIQQLVLKHCGPEYAPNLLIEAGRYLAGAHELKAYRVVKTKQVNDMMYYVMAGGIMSNLPDAWALGTEFPVIALNHLDSPPRPVRLAGLTCDPDDVYPSKRDKFVSMPADAEGLLIAFLDVGAYQDILSGKGGAKHCLLPEGATVLIGEEPEQPTRVSYRPPQPTEAVLGHLGYSEEPYSTF